VSTPALMLEIDPAAYPSGVGSMIISIVVKTRMTLRSRMDHRLLGQALRP